MQVIQNGANSAVGQYVVSIAKQKGAKTINIVRDRPNWQETVDGLTQLGADVVATPENVQSKTKEAGLEPILGLNCVGGQITTTMADLLQKGGVLVTYGAMTFEPVAVSATSFIFKDITLKGFWLSGSAAKDPQKHMQMMARYAMRELPACLAL